jgi:hypothetical protein
MTDVPHDVILPDACHRVAQLALEFLTLVYSHVTLAASLIVEFLGAPIALHNRLVLRVHLLVCLKRRQPFKFLIAQGARVLVFI